MTHLIHFDGFTGTLKIFYHLIQSLQYFVHTNFGLSPLNSVFFFIIRPTMKILCTAFKNKNNKIHQFSHKMAHYNGKKKTEN